MHFVCHERVLMRINLSIPEGQMVQVDRVAERLGLRRAEAVRHLLTLGLTKAQVEGSIVDQADAMQFFKDMAAAEAKAGQNQVRGLVTPGQGDKSGRGARRGAKGRRSSKHD